LDHQEKGTKTIDINRDEIFHKNSRVHPFEHKKNEEILKELKVETVDKKLRKQLKLATKRYEN